MAGFCRCGHPKKKRVHEIGICYPYLVTAWGQGFKTRWVCSDCLFPGVSLEFVNPPENEWIKVNRRREQLAMDGAKW